MSEEQVNPNEETSNSNSTPDETSSSNNETANATAVSPTSPTESSTAPPADLLEAPTEAVAPAVETEAAATASEPVATPSSGAATAPVNAAATEKAPTEVAAIPVPTPARLAPPELIAPPTAPSPPEETTPAPTATPTPAADNSNATPLMDTSESADANANAQPSNADNTTADDAALRFPCIEQPIRVTLHCRNGYYLWGLRKGRLVARKKRSDKDEFRVNYIDADAGIVEITNHKSGGILQVVVEEEGVSRGNGGGGAKVVCVKDEEVVVGKEEPAGPAADDKKEEEMAQVQNQGQVTEKATNNRGEETPTANANNNAEVEEEIEDETAVAINSTTSQKEDRQWCFVRGAHGEGILLKSLRTGDNLAIDSSGNVVLAADDTPEMTLAVTWDMECVTGELCFLSNPSLEKRIRCDMAGMLNLTNAWKGWEVFRIMETGNHHYVKISSWMHSQWLLCSTATGDVTCCSHAASLLLEDNNNGRCSLWAIEKSPKGESGQGVIIRSKAHHRLLSVKDGELKTYNPDTGGENEETTEALLVAAQQSSSSSGNSSSSSSKWWNNSVRSMNKSMNQSMRKVQKRLSQSSIKDDEKDTVVSQKDTLVWQVEAAHQQTYYFINVDNDNPKQQPRSIGPFPYATSNLRQTDKIQLKRTATSTKLYLTEKEQYISCSPEGDITLVFVYPDDDQNTEWIMEKPSFQEGGSVFRSKHHNFYLSYTTSNDDNGEEAEAEATPESSTGNFKNPFGSKPEPVAQLIGSETVGPRGVWKLEPCMPRAVSSDKIKTFALGTSIAVGTTIAMPFALAGASAVLGAVGSGGGVLFNVIAAGLTGAEALASVGAIGATAYVVFRPADNSLTDDHKKDDGERAWSKRPFSNWRNW